MLLKDKLAHHNIILASASPRRQQFFRDMGIDVKVRLKPVDEVYPLELKGSGISDYLAKLKARAFEGTLVKNDILITSDTVVWHKDKSLAKPKNADDCFKMLRTLSNCWHRVITSVCFTTSENQRVVNSTTRVKFSELTDSEIKYYIDAFKPYDKAGGYGIQEWIGLVAIEEIEGSYTNVVGLPTQLVYKTLKAMVN